MWRWPGWKTLFKSASPLKTNKHVISKWAKQALWSQESLLGVNYSAKMIEVLSTEVLRESLQ